MPCVLPLAVREQIILLHQQHYSAVHISQQLQINLCSIRCLVQRYKANPSRSLQPAYSNCGVRQPRSNERMLRAALWLKRLHTRWGAPLIHLHLHERYKTEHLPAVRTCKRGFEKKVSTRPVSTLPAVPLAGHLPRTTSGLASGETKEQLCLQDGQDACYLTIGG